MDKYEYRLKSEEIQRLLEEENYVEAAEIADTIDWRRVKSAAMLQKIAALYRVNRRNEDSKEILMLAYNRYPTNRSVLYSLCEVSIELDEVVPAIEFYKEFVRQAPRDNGVFTLRYKILEAQEASLEERIELLEELKKRDYQEEWGYELAYLYHRVGLATKCVEECDDIILWFGDGPIVMKAMELKMLHTPLTKVQQQNYEDMKYRQELEASGYAVEQENYQDSSYNEDEYYQDNYNQDSYYSEAYAPDGYENEQYMQEEYAQNGYEDGQYMQEEYAQNGYEDGQYMQEEYAQNGYEDGQYMQEEYAQNGYEDGQYMQEEYAQNGYEDGQYMQEEYAQNGYEDGQYMQEEYTQNGYEDEQYQSDAYYQNQPYEEEDSFASTVYQQPTAQDDLSQYNTINLQKVVADSMKELYEKDKNLFNTSKEFLQPQHVEDTQEENIYDNTIDQMLEEKGNLQENDEPEQNQDNAVEAAATQTFSMPEQNPILEKKNTGKMYADDVLSEWEQMKKNAEEKRLKEVRQRVLRQTGSILKNFETAATSGLLAGLEGSEEAAFAEDELQEALEEEKAAKWQEAIDVEQDKATEKRIEDVLTENSSGEEIAEEAIAREAIAKEAIAKESIAEKATEKEATAKDAAEEESIAEEATVEKATAKKADEEEATAREVAEEESTVEKTDAEKATAKDAAEEESIAEKTDAEDSKEEAPMEKISIEEKNATEVFFEEKDTVEEIVEIKGIGDTQDIIQYMEAISDIDEEEEDDSTLLFQPVSDTAKKQNEEQQEVEEAEHYEDEIAEEEAEYYEDEIVEEEAEYYEDEIAEEEAEYYEDEITEEEAEYYEDEITEEEAEYYEDEIAEEEAEYYEDEITEEEAEYYEDEITEEEAEYYEDEIAEGEAEYYEDEITEEEEASYQEDSMQVAIEQDLQEEETILQSAKKNLEEVTQLSETLEQEALGQRNSSSKIMLDTAEISSIEQRIIETTAKVTSPVKDEVRDFTQEEAELFDSFAQTKKVKKQIINALDKISLASYTGNVLITGEPGLGTVELAKNILKEVQATDNNFSGKVAKITGEKLNLKNLEQTFRKLNNGALLIEKANGCTEECLYNMSRVLDQEDRGIIVIMEDTRHNIMQLLKKQAMIADYFNIRIDLVEMNNDALVAYAKNYALEQEYSIDELGILALYTRIADIQAGNHVVTVEEVKDIVDEAIWNSKRFKISNFVDVLFAKRYDEDDMIVLRERDFI